METLLLVAIVLLALSSSSLTRAQTIVKIPPPRPLCASQYALANYACARVPMNTVPPPSPISPPPPPIPPPPPDHNHDHDHDDHNDNDHDHNDHDHDHDDNDHDHNSHDHNDHDDNDHGHNNHDHHNNNDSSHDGRSRHHHRGHHHHHHHRHIEETYAQRECCKWLKQMDNECVCELLVMLPPFLAKAVHHYTVFVDESCIITYTCGGRLIS